MRGKHITLGMILLFIISILILNIGMDYHVDSKIYRDKIINLDKGWTYKGIAVNIDENRLEIPSNQSYRLNNSIPNDIQQGDHLLIRGSLSDVTVFVADEMIYEKKLENDRFPRSPYASLWHLVEIPSHSRGDELSVVYRSPYENMNGFLNPIYYGPRGDILVFLLSQYGPPFVIDCLLLLVGIVLLILALFIPGPNYKEVMYLAFLAITSGLWLIAESRMLQFFIGNTPLIGSLAYLMLALVPLPFVGYVRGLLSEESGKPLILIVYSSCLSFVLINITQFLGIRDYFEMLWLTHGNIFLSSLLVMRQLFVDIRVKKNKLAKHCLVSLCVLLIFVLLELYQFTFLYSLHVTLLVRLGVLAFIMLLGHGVAKEFFAQFKKSYQAEFYEELAFLDQLTQGPNRMAFERDLEEAFLQEDDLSKLRMVILDLNKLKVINDTFGHVVGDDAIRTAYSLINTHFGHLGATYRIGGDEFACLIFNHSYGDYAKACATFEQSTRTLNAKKIYVFSIAYGSVQYNSKLDTTSEKMMHRADVRMYQEKKGAFVTELK